MIKDSKYPAFLTADFTNLEAATLWDLQQWTENASESQKKVCWYQNYFKSNMLCPNM